MSRTDVQDTLREMWETRPARPRDGRQVAGVAAAIARRYDIDPVLVRVGFVAAAFSGIGAALYIAGWLLLPDGPPVAGAATPSPGQRSVILVGLGIAVAITLGGVFGGTGPDFFLPLVAVAALLYLLHRSRGSRGTGATATTATAAGPVFTAGGAPTVPTATGATSQSAPGFAEARTTVTPTPIPPAWDPLGAAPFAWDLPEPAAPPPPPPRRLPVTSVTLGLAMLASGITAVILLLAGTLTLATLPILLGVVLAVIGLGLVTGGFLRAGRGLIPIALVLSALTWAVVAAPLDRWQGNGIGDLHASPAMLADLQPSYRRTAGDVQLDLRDVDTTMPTGTNSSPVRTTVSVGVGDVEIWLPPNADVSFTGTAGIGDIQFEDRSESGPGARLQALDDLGADGVASGRLLVLDVEMGAGSVEVHRG